MKHCYGRYRNHKSWLFYLARLVSVTLKQELQTSEISSKTIKHPFNKTLLVFADFFTLNARHAVYKLGKHSSDIVDWSHAFTLRKVLSQWFSTGIPRVAARGSAETDRICQGRNSQPQFYANVAIKTLRSLHRVPWATWTFAEGSTAGCSKKVEKHCTKRLIRIPTSLPTCILTSHILLCTVRKKACISVVWSHSQSQR